MQSNSGNLRLMLGSSNSTIINKKQQHLFSNKNKFSICKNKKITHILWMFFVWQNLSITDEKHSNCLSPWNGKTHIWALHQDAKQSHITSSVQCRKLKVIMSSTNKVIMSSHRVCLVVTWVWCESQVAFSGWHIFLLESSLEQSLCFIVRQGGDHHAWISFLKTKRKF